MLHALLFVIVYTYMYQTQSPNMALLSCLLRTLAVWYLASAPHNFAEASTINIPTCAVAEGWWKALTQLINQSTANSPMSFHSWPIICDFYVVLMCFLILSYEMFSFFALILHGAGIPLTRQVITISLNTQTWKSQVMTMGKNQW